MLVQYEVTVYMRCSSEFYADSLSRGIKKILEDVQEKLPEAIAEATVTINRLEIHK